MRGGGKEHRKQQSLGFGGGASGRREEKEEERDHIDRLSFSLSFPRFWEYKIVVPITCRIENSPFFALLLLFGEKRLFFYQSKNRKKSNERYKNNIFSIYRKEEGRKRALKSAHSTTGRASTLLLASLFLSLSLSAKDRGKSER